MKYEGMFWGLLGLGAALALFPNHFMRFRDGEVLMTDAQQPMLVGIARACAIALILIAAIALSDHYIF